MTKAHAGTDGMTLAAICEAAITLGDQDTRLDRTEPTLNEALLVDLRDTTTPPAMAQTLQRLVLGDALRPSSRAQLADWLVASQTGGTRLRAGVPAT